MNNVSHFLALILVCMLASSSAEAGTSLLDTMGVGGSASKESEAHSCIPKPPPKKPAQHSSAEGLPPLPLPVVPLRRTEKKNPPRPPVFVAKISTGSREDWATNPGDVDNLLRWMAGTLDVHFSSINMPSTKVPDNPAEIPVLYRTGHRAFTFSKGEKKRLRQYLIGGGTMVFDACCGREDFAVSAMKEIQSLIPERSPYLLSRDHPLYSAYYTINEFTFRPQALKAGAQPGEPGIIGVDIGCRTAIFFFRWDVSCGWDGLKDKAVSHCMGYSEKTAKQIGANLMAYISSERNTATPLSGAIAFKDADKKSSGKFVIVQATYKGLWHTRDDGLSMLLHAFNKRTGTPVKFERQHTPLDTERLFDAPFIYLTGHEEFTLSAKERDNLKRYLTRGGVLFAEACCGRKGFDRSFRREMAQTFNGTALKRLPSAHPIFRFPQKVVQVTPRPGLAARMKTRAKVKPTLLGLQMNGATSVIYSPIGLACGWEMAACPYCVGIGNADALALGINILSHILMQ